MSTFLSPNDLELKEAFRKILSAEDLSPIIKKIAILIYKTELDHSKLDNLLEECNINQIEDIKSDILDLLLTYINIILDDNVITEKEARNMTLLKRFFKIKEGDFYNYKYYEIERVLDRQFDLMYSNNDIDNDEALKKVELQDLFDLGYDQFLHLIEKTIKSALIRGANPDKLDTLIKRNYLIV